MMKIRNKILIAVTVCLMVSVGGLVTANPPFNIIQVHNTTTVAEQIDKVAPTVLNEEFEDRLNTDKWNHKASRSHEILTNITTISKTPEYEIAEALCFFFIGLGLLTALILETLHRNRRRH